MRRQTTTSRIRVWTRGLIALSSLYALVKVEAIDRKVLVKVAIVKYIWSDEGCVGWIREVIKRGCEGGVRPGVDTSG